MLLCLKSLRDGECFCSRYDENRQTMFYCGFFTTVAGFIWFIIGFTIRCAFFAEAFGPSVDAVACGIMVVGLMVLVIGLFSTISIVCTSKTNNKTSCVSSTTSTTYHMNQQQKRFNIGHNKQRGGGKDLINAAVFDVPMEREHYPRTGSFSSSELNSSFATSSSTMSSRPSTTSQNIHSYRSDIAIIA